MLFKKTLQFSLLITFLMTGLLIAEEAPPAGWKKSLIVDFTTTQTGYSDSWVGGEAGSVNWVSNLNGSAEKQLSNKFNLKSTLKLSFGQTLIQDAETKKWSKPKKSTDLIDFENVGKFTLGGFFDPYIAFRAESQFFDGRKDDQKLYLSPMKLTESAGIVKKLYAEKDDFVSSRFGFAFRQIMKTEIDSIETLPMNWSYENLDTTLTDGGIESVTDATLSLHKNLRYNGKLTLYKALFFSKSDEVKGTPYEDDWKAVDVNWENIITAQITKIIAINLYTQLLYDKEISKKGRLKETVAIGFVFKMI